MVSACAIRAPSLSQASAENALRAFLANPDQFGSGRAEARDAVIVVRLKRFPERNAHAGNTPDNSMMTSQRVFDG